MSQSARASLAATMPTLLLSGVEDALGNYGEGAYHLANLLWKQGNHHVRTRVYLNARRCIYREAASQQQVREEIFRFIDELASSPDA